MSDWKLDYSGIYMDGAKIKTEHNGTEVCVSIRREFDTPVHSFVLDQEQATELAYAILKSMNGNIVDQYPGTEDNNDSNN